MQAQRICTAVVRSNASPLISFLTPSINTPTIPRCIASVPAQSRHLSSTRCKQSSENPARPSTTKGGPLGFDRKIVAQAQATKERSESSKPLDARSRSAPRQQASEATPATSPAPTFGTPLGLKGVGPRSGASGRQQEIKDLLHSLSQPREKSGSMVRDRATPMTTAQRRQEAIAQDPDRMLLLTDKLFNNEHQRPPVPPPIRLDAYMGRAAFVDRDKPIGARISFAMANLSSKLRENNIRSSFFRQKFHERNGLKRKRLRSERWRTRFNGGFIHMVEKVAKMRAQGW